MNRAKMIFDKSQFLWSMENKMKKALFLLLISTPIKKHWPKKWWKNSVSLIFMMWALLESIKRYKFFKTSNSKTNNWSLVIWPFNKILVVRT
jgi:hypothetical protein